MIERHYKHKFQKEAKRDLIPVLKSGKPLWKQQIFISLLIGLFLVLLTFLFQKVFTKQDILNLESSIKDSHSV